MKLILRLEDMSCLWSKMPLQRLTRKGNQVGARDSVGGIEIWLHHCFSDTGSHPDHLS